MKNEILKSSFVRVFEIVTVTLISLALTPYLIKHLGDNNYGLWLLILSTLGWFNFIDLGFSAAVRREIAIALESSNTSRINVVFSVSVVLFSVLGVVAASFIGFLAIYPEILGITEVNRHVAAVSIGLLTLKVLFDFIMNSFHGFFSAYLRMDIDANISLANTIIKSVIVYFLIVDMNIYGAVIATITADFVTHLLKIYFASKLHKGFEFSFKFISILEVKSLFLYSKHVIASGIASAILRRSDPIVISHIMGLKYVALYGVINTLINQVEALVRAVVDVLNPVITRLVARQVDIGTAFKQTIDINIFLVILLYTPLAILTEDFVTLWIGEKYSFNSDLAFVLGGAFICKAISRPVSAVLLAQANHQLLSVLNLIGAVINIALSIVFAQKWGLLGVAYATMVSYIISECILHLVLLKKYSKQLSLVKPVFKILIAALIYIGSVLIGKEVLSKIPPLNWIELFVSAAIIVTILFTFLWFIILGTQIRQQLINILLKRIK
jgi:O-antigen/teichoic acid export membrane protein